MIKRYSLSLLTLAFLAAYTTTTKASIDVTFTESAPKDRFVITNNGKCTLQKAIINIDLKPSVGRLFFDTSSEGAGIQVFQPFEATSGQYQLISQNRSSSVMDGDDQLSLAIDQLSPGATISFTIDVDDRLTNSERGQTQITGAEIEGAEVSLTHYPYNLAAYQERSYRGRFGKNSIAKISNSACA